MARIAGVDLPREKRVEVGLTYIYGIGLSTSQKLLKEAEVNPDTRVKDLTDDQKKDYKNLIERQYQNISYKIKDENTSGENATVTVEVETFDYRSALNKSEEYYENNKKKFQKDDGKIDQKKYWDYKISEMKKTEDKIKNEIIFTLHKENDKWILDDISDSDRQKLHGLYGG